jgi:hypothetical protein
VSHSELEHARGSLLGACLGAVVRTDELVDREPGRSNMIPTDPRVVSREYEAYVSRIMNENRLHNQAWQARQVGEPWYSRRLTWLMCEMDAWRTALAERLCECELAQSLARFWPARALLHMDRAFLPEDGRCA